MKVFLLDNYDSFTYNIAQLLETLGVSPCVRRDASASIPFIEDYSPDRVIISPGPMRPENHRFINTVIERFHAVVPILGICLGMQAINVFFGGNIRRAPAPVHGKTSKIYHCGEGILKGIPSPFISARYHSLIVSNVPDVLKETAFTEDGVPMALMHRREPVFGVQFHPESYLSMRGRQIMKNFLKAAR